MTNKERAAFIRESIDQAVEANLAHHKVEEVKEQIRERITRKINEIFLTSIGLDYSWGGCSIRERSPLKQKIDKEVKELAEGLTFEKPVLSEEDKKRFQKAFETEYKKAIREATMANAREMAFADLEAVLTELGVKE